MWIWIIIIAAVIGALWGYISDEGRGESAAAGGCMGAFFA